MPMHPRLGAFRAALVTGWVGLSAAGLIYARQKNIPLWAAVPVIAAFLVEYPFYLAPGCESVHVWLRTRLSRARLGAAMVIAGILPYLIYSIPTGEFRWLGCAILCGIVGAISFWYVGFRPSPIVDIGFLVLLAGVMLSRVLPIIYTSHFVKGFSILGHLMLIHTGALAALLLRGTEGVGFGFIPAQKEWIIGAKYFFYFLPIGFPLAIWLDVAHLHFTGEVPLFKALAYFFGALWVTALSEEFFFRGLLQQWLANWTRRPWLALGGASLIYGAAHLGSGAFPNWRMAVIDSVLGCFCGLAYWRSAGIRSSMVTHALVVAIWKTLFTR